MLHKKDDVVELMHLVVDLLQAVRDAVHVLLVDLRALLGRHAQGHSPVPLPSLAMTGAVLVFCIISSALKKLVCRSSARRRRSLHPKNRSRRRPRNCRSSRRRRRRRRPVVR